MDIEDLNFQPPAVRWQTAREIVKPVRVADFVNEPEPGSYSPFSMSYVDLYRRFGEVIHEEHLSSYQGDVVVLMKIEGRWAFGTCGYGSCSGCDALQAADSLDDLQRIMDDLIQGTRVFDDTQSAMNYFSLDGEDDGDKRGKTYYSSASEYTAFCAAVRAILEPDMPKPVNPGSPLSPGRPSRRLKL